MRCNTCMQECEPVLVQYHREGRMGYCQECVVKDDLLSMLERRSKQSKSRRDTWNCPVCFYPINQEPCGNCAHIKEQGK